MSEAEELTVAIFGLAFVVAIFVQLRSLQMRELIFFFAGAVLIFSASVFVILEKTGWEEAFKLMEHLCYASAGICFLVGCSLLGRRFKDEHGGAS